MNRLRSPIRWFGGKGRLDLNNWVLPILESIPHKIYVEVFGGGGGLLVAKKPSPQEVYNDIDSSLYEFFEVISKEDLFQQFYRRISVLPYSRQLYEESKNYKEEPDKIERVSKWFIVIRNKFGGIPDSEGWCSSSSSKDAWLNCIPKLVKIHKRLQNVVLENSDWRKILSGYDNEEILLYLDPPYVHSTRTGGGYDFEISEEDHEELVEKILNLKSHVVLSGYENEIYKPLENNGWKLLKKRVAVFSSSSKEGEKKNFREECLWIKPFIDKRKIFFV